MKRVATILTGLTVVCCWTGCGRQEPSPPYNYAMGSEPGQLLPTAEPPIDLRILEDQAGLERPGAAGPATRPAGPGPSR